eukprot:1666794-Alexandrium_andersonii.AAC.1
MPCTCVRNSGALCARAFCRVAKCSRALARTARARTHMCTPPAGCASVRPGAAPRVRPGAPRVRPWLVSAPRVRPRCRAEGPSL